MHVSRLMRSKCTCGVEKQKANSVEFHNYFLVFFRGESALLITHIYDCGPCLV